MVSGTSGLTGERMSKIDTAWLRMYTSANLMMIVGVWIIKPGVSYKAVCKQVQDKNSRALVNALCRMLPALDG